MDEPRQDRDRSDRLEAGDQIRSVADSTDDRPPLTTVWTVRFMFGVFVVLAGFFAFVASWVIELFLVSLVASPQTLPPITIVPLLAVSVVVTAVAIRAVVRRLRRGLGPIA
jgi:quinol-cytochrome oxidoreductase complex cytochrome b subunit